MRLIFDLFSLVRLLSFSGIFWPLVSTIDGGETLTIGELIHGSGNKVTDDLIDRKGLGNKRIGPRAGCQLYAWKRK